MARQDHGQGLHALAPLTLLKTQTWAYVRVEDTVQCVYTHNILLMLRLIAFLWIPTHLGPLR